MRAELPTQAEIIEELADRVAAQIDQRRPVAFDSALEELVRYHRFALGLGASTTPEGTPFNYAEIAGGDWHAPHQAWLMQYRRLFDLAAERVPENDHFIRALAYTLARLLRLPEGLIPTPAIAESVLDLFPGLIHSVEAWVTRRAVVEIDGGSRFLRHYALAGSDAKAHAASLRGVIGAWESLFTHAPMMSDVANPEGKDEAEQWIAVGRAWPFAWTHLLNTAYSLALCVWNEDGEGALVLREALVRWPENYRFLLPDAAFLRRHDLLFPDVIEQDWATAQRDFAALAYQHDAPTTPGALFATALDGAHDDVLQLVASLFTLWSIQEKAAGPLAAKTARELLAHEGAERHGAPPRSPSADDLLLRFLRLQMAGGRHRDGTYGARLDKLVQTLDRMSERDVVAGRVYTPTTIHDRDETLLADVALLAAFIDRANGQNLLDRVRALAEQDDLLPRGDRSLRDILYELERYQGIIAVRYPAVLAGIEGLGGETAEAQLVLLGKLIAQVQKVIGEVRIARLRTMPIDPARIDEWRTAVEAQLFDPGNLEFFASAQIEKVEGHDVGELCSYRFPDYPKARLTNPTMGDEVSNEIEVYSRRVAEWADGRTFGLLYHLPKTEIAIASEPLDPAFWEALRPLVAQVGPAPRLVLPQDFRQSFIEVAMEPQSSRLSELSIVSAAPRAHGYICQVDGVDVYIESIDKYRAILFSGVRLQRVRYGVLEDGNFVRVAFQPNEEVSNAVNGVLEFQFRQEAIWNETPMFEIALPGAPKSAARRRRPRSRPATSR